MVLLYDSFLFIVKLDIFTMPKIASNKQLDEIPQYEENVIDKIKKICIN